MDIKVPCQSETVEGTAGPSPFRGPKGARCLARFDPADPDRYFGPETAKRRRPL